MAFNIPSSESDLPESPAALFETLRARKVPALLPQQLEVLQAYADSFAAAPDVAIKVLTGGGKTLIGVLIAEWRRRVRQERVVFACPTKQLVHQVVAQCSQKFGITARPFVDRVVKFNSGHVQEYESAESIAVTTYSHIFNVRPFFTDAQTIVLDDVHAAEPYIIGNWSIHIQAWEEGYEDIFEAIAGTLKRKLSPEDFRNLTSSSGQQMNYGWVSKLSSCDLVEVAPEISAALDSRYYSDSLPAGVRFPWENIRGSLLACHVYLGPKQIQIRPLIAPTFSHRPFTGAAQRVYMSATLARNGDLERIVGRPGIQRIPEPTGAKKQGIGRRLFFFPERSLGSDDIVELHKKLIGMAGRAVVLVPDEKSALNFEKFVLAGSNFQVFRAKEIEQSKDAFTEHERAVALLANRYDGIDFPHDECRLVIAHALPRALGLQEQFLVAKLSASQLLDDRVNTRLVQAFGRCTRAANDYSLVVVAGGGIAGALNRTERRSLLHPELQAELEFGMEQSKNVRISDFLENFRLFLEQKSGWAPAEGAIVKRRNAAKQKSAPSEVELANTVALELDYIQAMWNGAYVQAHSAARAVASKLTISELKGYRSLWHYLSGAAAVMQEAAKGDFDKAIAKGRPHFREAFESAPSMGWLASLVERSGGGYSDGLLDGQTLAIIERFGVRLEELGTVSDTRFDQTEKEIREGLKQSEATAFEQAQCELGRLLGFDAGKIEADATPDPWWRVDSSLVIVFEDHSNGLVGGVLGANKVRQADSYHKWVRANLPVSEGVKILKVIVTPATRVSAAGFLYADDIYVWKIEDFRKWSMEALRVVRGLRGIFHGADDLEWRARAVEEYRRANIAPPQLQELLSTRRAHDVLVKEA